MGLGDLESMTVAELLVSYEQIHDELTSRNVVRTRDAPAGQFAEWLARTALGGHLAPNSEKAYDLDNQEFGRVQVKCRVLRGKSGERRLSPFRSKYAEYDRALILLFASNYEVARAVMLTSDQVSALTRRSDHVNGELLTASVSVLAQGVDITSRFSPMSFVDVPDKPDVKSKWVEFASTFDAYAANGGLDSSRDIWRSTRVAFETQLPARRLDALRTSLFMEYRADRHGGGVGELNPFVSYLVDEIRDLSGGTVLFRGAPVNT